MPEQWPEWTPNWLIATVEATVESSQYSPWSTPRDSVVSRAGGSIARRRSSRYTSFNGDRVDTPDTIHGANTYRLSSRQAVSRSSGIDEILRPLSPSSVAEPERNSVVTEYGRNTPSIRRPLSPMSLADSQAQSTQDLAAFLSSLTHSSDHMTEITFTGGRDTAIAVPPATPTIGTNEGLKAGGTQISRGSISAADEETKEDESQYPTKWVAMTITLGICLVSFATAVDNTIITTAIPSITSDFNTLSDTGWYGSAYLLASCALQPTYGKIFTFFHVKWTYLSALLLFEVGSVICATAPSSLVLIIGRAVAGMGGAGLTSGGSTIIAGSVPIHKRGLFNSSLASTFGIASVTGPLLGGALTDKLSWRWCFWINLPLGAVAFLVVFLVFKPPRRQATPLPIVDRVLRLDFMGSSAFISGIICLLLALQWGGTVYPWSDSRVWGTLLGFVLLIACFTCVQIYRQDNALIPPRVLSKRTVLSSVIFQALLCMGIYAHFYYLPYYFQVVQGTDATQSGIRTIPYVTSLSLFAIIAGALVQFLGFFAPFMWLGAALFTIAAGLMHTLRLHSPEGVWVGFQVLAGAGAGAAFQMPLLAVQCSVAETDVPVGNAMVGFFMTLGSSISVSVAQNIFSNSLGRGLSAIPGLNPQQIIDAGATGVREVTPPQMLTSVLEAYNDSIMAVFVFSIAAGGSAFLCSLFAGWKSVKSRSKNTAELGP